MHTTNSSAPLAVAGTPAGSADADPAAAARAMQSIHPLVQRILAARGLDDPHLLHAFVNASLRDLHDTRQLPNIGMAVDRIIKSLQRAGPLVIYGDYDVDGITASSILYHTFRTAAPEADIQIYIPHRIDEGYGLNAKALERMHADGVDLVVSVDCGITAHDAAARAKELGLDLIITDHHNPPAEGDPLPDAFAIVHPRLPGSAYPFGELCGAGVAFKVAWDLARTWCGSERVSESFRQMLTECLAFAALGTIADIVPLRDENRVIAKYGLRMMKHTRFIGLNALITATGLDDESIDSEAVGFRIGPRLNAAGRMGHAREAAVLLTEAQPAQAATIARELNTRNEERRATERDIFEQACNMAEAAGMTGDDQRVIVLAHPDWHVGVIGIVASNLVERFGRPAVLLHDGGDLLKGSARSIPGYSIHAGLQAASEWLAGFGGHDMAAGLSVVREKFDNFVEALSAHANEHISVEELTPCLAIDCEATLDDLASSAVQQVLDLGPFGADNPRPTLLLRN
ncbi:MAG: single-stranded-DNA-specific exonuclease RecJ, partial [Planctomycetota bacterium]